MAPSRDLRHNKREFSGLEKPSGKELQIKKSRYTDESIAFALMQAETGTPVAEVIRRMGISDVLPLEEGVRRLRLFRAESSEATRG